MNLDKLITVFQGFFSRAFWFGSFLPVAVVAATHLVIAGLQYPKLVPLNKWSTATFESLTLFPVVFAGLVVLAYALTPLIPFLRGVLDGSLLPEWMHNWVRRAYVISMRAAGDRIGDAMERSAGYDRLIRREIPRLQGARAAGMNGNQIGDPNLIIDAEHSIKDLQTKIKSGATPTIADAQSTVDALAAAWNAIPRVCRRITPTHHLPFGWRARTSCCSNC